MAQKDIKQTQKERFEIFYNTLSVGWHLRKIMEVDEDFISENWEQFEFWLERHKVKKKN